MQGGIFRNILYHLSSCIRWHLLVTFCFLLVIPYVSCFRSRQPSSSFSKLCSCIFPFHSISAGEIECLSEETSGVSWCLSYPGNTFVKMIVSRGHPWNQLPRTRPSWWLVGSSGAQFHCHLLSCQCHTVHEDGTTRLALSWSTYSSLQVWPSLVQLPCHALGKMAVNGRDPPGFLILHLQPSPLCHALPAQPHPSGSDLMFFLLFGKQIFRVAELKIHWVGMDLWKSLGPTPC